MGKNLIIVWRFESLNRNYMGLGTARGGHLFCNQKISWVQFPIAPLENQK